MRLCEQPGCDHKHLAFGMCRMHYMRDRRTQPGYVRWTAPIEKQPSAYERIEELFDMGYRSAAKIAAELGIQRASVIRALKRAPGHALHDRLSEPRL